MVSISTIMLYSILQASGLIFALEDSSMKSSILPRATPPNSPEISSRPDRKSSSTESSHAITSSSTISKSPSLSSSSLSDIATQQTPNQQGTSGAKRRRSPTLKTQDSSSDSQDPARYIKSSMKADVAEKKAKIDRSRARKLVHEFNNGPAPIRGPDRRENLENTAQAARFHSDQANHIAASSRALSKVYRTVGRHSRGAGETERARINEYKAEIARKTGSMWSSEYRRAKLSASSLNMIGQAWETYYREEPRNNRAQYHLEKELALGDRDKAFRHRGKAKKKRLEVQNMEEQFGRFSDGDQSLVGHPEYSLASDEQSSRPSTPESMSSVGKPESLSDTASSAGS